jgi:hypothetical protein
MFFKSSSDPPPPDSDVDSEDFLLGIQTPYQRKCFHAWGRDFARLDATHNTTYYATMLLFTVIVQDRHGHGMPIAWMIASNGQADTIDYFLMYLHQLNPDIIPHKFMSDNDSGQLGQIRFRYSLSQLMLCWWHVLHAWQQHFVTRHYPELWEKLKGWIRITDKAEFWACWEEIKSLAEDTERLNFDNFDDLVAPDLSLSPVPIASSPPAISSPQHVESTAPPPIMPPASTHEHYSTV